MVNNNPSGSVKQPASEYVEVLGYRVPVYPYMVVGEHIELERLMKRALQGELSPLEHNLEALASVIRHRLKLPVVAQDLTKLNLTSDELVAFEDKVDRLTDPFAQGYRKTVQARQQKALKAVARAMQEQQETTGS